MRKLLISLGLLCALASPALASTCPQTALQVKDNIPNTASMAIIDDGSGNGTCLSDPTEGTKADTAATDSTSSWSVVAILKGIWAKLSTIATNTAAAIPAQSNHTTNIGAVDSISPYPATAVPVTASATGTTTATTATLTNVTSHTTYICGFSIRANATAAATNNATVTGTITGTLNFTQWTAPLASGLGVTEEVFSPCVPASGVSTSIAVVSGAPGSGGVVSVSAWGYSL